ncbi:LCP family protein [candidate division WWE3 bacterium]|uniref:LCP family protein n=1 Tax=candidate division WWE3 bacterium TaxID=2053526 RepID=A0A7X9E774_UNCKA|nr:LCP family protein [candidate division WWE3 bacterium]
MNYTDIYKQKSILRKEVNNKGLVKFILLLVVLCVIGASLYVFRGRIKQTFNPISIVSNVAAANLKETDGRINILVLGSDKRDVGAEQGRATLTDTILVASIGTTENDVVLISLPRDLWVSDYQTKINAVYAYKGIDGLKEQIEKVMGIPIHYHILVTFNLFEQAIEVLNGIEVNVENAFVDNFYPIEGKENDTCGKNEEEIKKLGDKISEYDFPCRFERVEFKSGLQKMDGKTALKYARSRHGDNDENTDFARAKRQQKVISAIKDKIFSLETVLSPAKIKGLYDAYAQNVDTNIDFQTLENFYMLSQKLDLSKIESIVLDDRSDANSGGLLYHPVDSTLYGGAYVLIPQTGDFSQIHAYVQKYLFGDK